MAAIGLVAAVPSHAGLVFSIEGPGVQASTVSGVTTEDFNSQGTGPLAGSIAVGTLSVGGSIVAPNAFGGSAPPAAGSDYYAVGVQSGQNQATLTLSSPQNYFGMYWPAGDTQNKLSLYNGATLLGAYSVFDIIATALSSGYYGNPNNGLDSGEPFVYLNFTTTGTDFITSIVFQNNQNSGFEMDNFSIATGNITPPGTVVPEPTTMIAGALLLLPFGVSTLRMLRKKTQTV